jgi:hypothetical protein
MHAENANTAVPDNDDATIVIIIIVCASLIVLARPVNNLLYASADRAAMTAASRATRSFA